MGHKELENIKKNVNCGATKWTYDNLQKECLKYISMTEFQKNSPSAYNKCRKYSLLDIIGSHLKRVRKPNNYWTKEKCEEIAKLYDNHGDFRLYDDSAVCAARRLKCYSEITSHFIVKGSKHARFIYSYEFLDNHVYVGLTYNLNERQAKHAITGSVYEHCVRTNCRYNFVVHTEKPVEPEIAKILEEECLKKYVMEGWIPLNKVKTGSTGGDIIKWNFEECFKEALKFNSRQEFYKKSPSAYSSSLKNKWMDKVCGHMVILKKPSGFYKTKDNCIEEALKCESRSELQSSCSAAYKSIIKNNWSIEAFQHMKIKKQPRGYYTLEKCIEIAKNCNHMNDIRVNYGTAYNKIFKNKWYDKIKENFIKNEL